MKPIEKSHASTFPALLNQATRAITSKLNKIDKNDPKTRLYLLSSDGKKATIKEIHITKVSKTIKAVLMLF